MRERKYVKIKVSMYDDTKFKIIDMKAERDLIHYVWNRVVVLAGKVNLDGELYLSKNIPYTIETLAIEFNRDVEQVRSAFDVLIELEMIEFTEDKIYIVKNFAKHQNIKVKKKDKSEDKEDSIINKKDEMKENIEAEVEMPVDNISYSNGKFNEDKLENSKNDCKEENIDNETINSAEHIDNGDMLVNNVNDNKSDKTTVNNVPIILDTKRVRKVNKKKKSEDISDILKESNEEEDVVSFKEGDCVLGPGEQILKDWSF